MQFAYLKRNQRNIFGRGNSSLIDNANIAANPAVPGYKVDIIVVAVRAT